MTTTTASIIFNPEDNQLICSGKWDLATLSRLKRNFRKIEWPATGKITIDGGEITQMDSSGAWLLTALDKFLHKKGLEVEFVNLPERIARLLELIKNESADKSVYTAKTKLRGVASIGKSVIDGLQAFKLYLAFIGELSAEFIYIILHPRHWRLPAITQVIFNNGFAAIPIIALLSFMIGIVITYQMGIQLRSYGANIYVVDLLGLSILREFGPLLTAIMVAGRTGSAFTAELGMMKLNQEIDALNTLGVTPAELLLIPRIIGLLIALPLLTMISDVLGILGGMVMSEHMLSITWSDFLHRFPRVIPLRAFLLGLMKAPIFALIIASVGCFQGMQVSGSADSVGKNTTRSVVLSIFFIILADAVISILLSRLKL